MVATAASAVAQNTILVQSSWRSTKMLLRSCQFNRTLQLPFALNLQTSVCFTVTSKYHNLLLVASVKRCIRHTTVSDTRSRIMIPNNYDRIVQTSSGIYGTGNVGRRRWLQVYVTLVYRD